MLVRLAIMRLFCSDENYEIQKESLPLQLQAVCEARRPQANKFLNEFLQRKVSKG